MAAEVPTLGVEAQGDCMLAATVRSWTDPEQNALRNKDGYAKGLDLCCLEKREVRKLRNEASHWVQSNVLQSTPGVFFEHPIEGEGVQCSKAVWLEHMRIFLLLNASLLKVRFTARNIGS